MSDVTQVKHTQLQEVIEGLQIFAKYGGESCSAELDVIYCGPDDGQLIPDADFKRLEELGWFYNGDAWHHLA